MEFTNPIWLWLIPVIILLMASLIAANRRARKLLVRRFASDRLVAQLLRSYSPARIKFKNLLLFLSFIALFIALARPIIGYEWQETRSKGIDILFALDASRSMLAEDIKPNRLERAKLAILDFIEQLEGDRVGLIAFAGEAFLQCPLTLDYNAFRQSLEAVDTNIISTGGTDIASAIDEADNAFQEDKNFKIIILITDGEDLEESGLRRARVAAEEGVIIYSVGVGTAEGGVIPIRDRWGRLDYLRDDAGEIVHTRLDAETLSAIAEATDGFYVPLGATGYGLEQVYEAGLASIPEEELSSQMERKGIERFQWPLALAVLLLAWEPLIGTRRRRWKVAPAAVLAASLWLWAAQEQPLHAQEAAAGKAITDSKADRPEPEDARQHYNLGNRYYEDGHFSDAALAYRQALDTLDLELQSDVFYNLGNTRYRQGNAELDELGDLAALDTADEESFQNTDAALGQGNDILERASAHRIPPSLRRGDAEVVPQQEIQQAIQMAEQAKKQSEETKSQDAEASSTLKATNEFWEQAAKDYESALELNPGAEDALFNAGFVEQRLKEISEIAERRATAIQQHERNVEMLEAMIEALKKLLDDPDQDNQENEQEQQEQEQDQQQNQEQQEQQDGQDQQEQQDGEGQQDSSQQGEQEPSEGQDDASNEDGQQQAEPSGQDPQEGESASSESGQEDGSEESDAGQEPAPNPEDGTSGQDEQNAGEDEAQGNADEAPMQLSEEDARQAEAMAAGEDGAEGREAGAAAQLGVMSREQARRLLDSMKDEEKKLPVSGYGPRKYRVDEEGQRKDW